MQLAVPGHSTDPAAAPRLADMLGERTLKLDTSMLITGLDKGENNPLDRSLALAAEAFHARKVWFLTNGASQANRIVGLALAGFGPVDAPVLAQRSAHSSFIDGAILADLQPVFMQPSVDARHGINHGISTAALTMALLNNPDAKAVYIVSPSYFGAVADIAGIAAIAHGAGLPLIVDAAWGAHFGFHPDLPLDPIRLGADLVVSSTHKLGGSLTQSAMLHLAEGPFAAELEQLIDRVFPLTASTSSSALLQASLDIARADLVDGQERIAFSIAQAERFRDRVRNHPLLELVSDSFVGYADVVRTDPLRVSIDVHRLGLTGHEVREILGSKYGIYMEISTVTSVVAFTGPGYAVDLDRVFAALDDIAREPLNDLPELRMPDPGPVGMRPRQAFFAAHEIVPAEAAVGRLSADSLAAYPPGIPNVLPGEVITADTVAFLRSVARSDGGYVRGSINRSVSDFHVVK